MDADTSKNSKIVFKDRSNEQKEKLVSDKDKKSTQRATAGYLNQFSRFLQVKQHPSLEDLHADVLGDILYDYYSSV